MSKELYYVRKALEKNQQLGICYDTFYVNHFRTNLDDDVCVASPSNLLKTSIYFCFFIYVLAKMYENQRRALAGFNGKTVSIDFHLKMLVGACIWCVTWGIYNSYTTVNVSPDSVFFSYFANTIVSMIFTLSMCYEIEVIYLLKLNSIGRKTRQRLKRTFFLVLIPIFSIDFCGSMLSLQWDKSIYFWWTKLIVDFICFIVILGMIISYHTHHFKQDHNLRKFTFNLFYLQLFAKFCIVMGDLLLLLRLDAGVCFREVADFIQALFYIPFMYRALKADCYFWVIGTSIAEMDIDDDDDAIKDGNFTEKNAMKLMTQDTILDEAPKYRSYMIPDSELYYHSTLDSRADSSVELQRWRRQKVVVKYFVLDFLTTDNITYFRQEADTAINLKDVNVIQTLGVTFDPPRLGIVIEYCPLGDLDQLLKKFRNEFEKINADFIYHQQDVDQMNQKMSEKYPIFAKFSVKRLALEIASGMKYLHHKKVLHRDLKSMNVFLDRNMKAKIADFGACLQLKTANDKMTENNKTTDRIEDTEFSGTPAWGAPELLTSTELPTFASDVYSYGILMWELLHWSLPYIYITKQDTLEILKIDKRAQLTPVADFRLGQTPEDMENQSNFENDMSTTGGGIGVEMATKLKKRINKRKSNNIMSFDNPMKDIDIYDHDDIFRYEIQDAYIAFLLVNKSKIRPPKLLELSEDFVELMEICYHGEKESRPSFEEICNRMNSFAEIPKQPYRAEILCNHDGLLFSTGRELSSRHTKKDSSIAARISGLVTGRKGVV